MLSSHKTLRLYITPDSISTKFSGHSQVFLIKKGVIFNKQVALQCSQSTLSQSEIHENIHTP